MEEKDKEILINTATLAVVEALRVLGLTSGEVSGSQAASIYGTEFRELVKAGKLRPVRVGHGARGTKYYSVAEIIAARAAEREKATLL